MKIIRVKIINFRGLDIELKELDEKSLLIGQNDSGKSNVCSAIMKVFSPEKRRKPLYSNDSSYSNNQNIEFHFTLELSNITKQQLGYVQDYIYSKDDINYMDVWMVCEFNGDTLQYEDKLYFGDESTDSFEIPTDKQNKLDKILSVVYIDPTYDLTNEKKNYFTYKEIKKVENQIALGNSIKATIDELRSAVKTEPVFNDVITDLNDLGDFELIFEGLNFELSPNIKIDNIFNSLDILNVNSGGKQIDYIGDGKTKVLSMLLRTKTVDNEKCKIFIIEEPENHLYVLLQRYYLSAILSLSPHQIVITTHSPFIVDFEKINRIIKISKKVSQDGEIQHDIHDFNINNEDFKKFGYLINSEIAEMIYYDNVLLVEGYSEKYFYNLLTIKDARFTKFLTKNKFGIYSIGGIAFKKTKELLEALGINVYIKTDNDTTKIKCNDIYVYSGLRRVLSLVSEQTKKEILEILNFDNDDIEKFKYEDNGIEIIENKINDICLKLKEERILFSNHHEGFERDLLEYLNVQKGDYEEKLEYLKSAKLKNLHDFISDYNIDISINEKNRNSILLGFVNENEIFE